MTDNYNRLPEREKMPTVLGSNILYLLVLTLMLGSGILFSIDAVEAISPNEFYFRTFALQVAIIGLPPLLYLLYNGMDVSNVIRLNKIKVKEAFLVVGMAVFGYGMVIFVNYVWMWIIGHIGPPIPQPTPPVETGGQYIAALLCIAVMPALVEEFLFRGVILRGYETMGRRVGVIMSGLLFALLHMSLSSLPAIIFLGIMISYIVQRSNSIVSGIIYHFTNNAIAMTLVYVANTLMADINDLQNSMPEDFTNMSPEAFLAGLVGFVFIMIFSLVMFMLCLNAFKKSTEDRAVKSYVETAKAMRIVKPVEMLPAVVAMVVIGILLVIEVLAMATAG